MLAIQADIAVIDFETTGVCEGFADEPWQIGAVRVENGYMRIDTAFTSLLRIGDRPFSPYAPGRHERLRGELKTAPTLPGLWPRLGAVFAADAICAHNVPVEKKFLRNAFPLQPASPWIDTLKLARIAYPGFQSHKLEDLIVSTRLEGRLRTLLPDLAPHDALYDAAAAALLLEHLLQRPEWKGVTLEALIHA